MKEITDLQAGFKATRNPADIAANRKLLEAAYDALRLAQTVVSSMASMNHQLCPHTGSRGYTDRSGVPCTDCPHCGGD